VYRLAALAFLMVMASARAQAPVGHLREAWNEMVQAHNAVRVPMNLRPLVWSEKVAAVAQEWADRLAARDEFVHRLHRPRG